MWWRKTKNREPFLNERTPEFYGDVHGQCFGCGTVSDKCRLELQPVPWASRGWTFSLDCPACQRSFNEWQRECWADFKAEEARSQFGADFFSDDDEDA